MNNIGVDRIRTDNSYDFKNNFNNNINEEQETVSIYGDTGHTCNYFDIEEFTEKAGSINKQISFFSHNVRSLPGKWFEFADLIQALNTDTFKFTVISVTELWNVPPEVNFQLPGYSPLQKLG